MRQTPLLAALTAVALMIGADAQPAKALDGKAIVAEGCVSCHNVIGPAPSSFQAVLERRAPDLFYAGNKFKRSWLVEWLRRPTIIRRAGTLFLNHVVNEGGKDRVREETVEACAAKLSPDQSEAVADYLMTLKDPAAKAAVVDPATSYKRLKAWRLFSKQMPCIGCHTVKFGKRVKGGISGPDLSTAGERLNPDWVYAMIQDPQYWDPKGWMPKIEMSHNKRELLTLFVASMK